MDGVVLALKMASHLGLLAGDEAEVLQDLH